MPFTGSSHEHDIVIMYASDASNTQTLGRRGKHVAAAVRDWLSQQDGLHLTATMRPERQLSVSCHFELILAPIAHESVMKASTASSVR